MTGFDSFMSTYRLYDRGPHASSVMLNYAKNYDQIKSLFIFICHSASNSMVNENSICHLVWPFLIILNRFEGQKLLDSYLLVIPGPMILFMIIGLF